MHDPVVVSSSYLVRFLSRVADYSSENKMTPSNLAICIGCSILYPQDATPTSSSLTNAYANGSILLETMIHHHRSLFPSSMSTTQPEKSSPSQPDLIPTDFYPVRSSSSTDRFSIVRLENSYSFQRKSPRAQQSVCTRPAVS